MKKKLIAFICCTIMVFTGVGAMANATDNNPETVATDSVSVTPDAGLTATPTADVGTLTREAENTDADKTDLPASNGEEAAPADNGENEATIQNTPEQPAESADAAPVADEDQSQNAQNDDSIAGDNGETGSETPAAGTGTETPAAGSGTGDPASGSGTPTSGTDTPAASDHYRAIVAGEKLALEFVFADGSKAVFPGSSANLSDVFAVVDKNWTVSEAKGVEGSEPLFTVTQSGSDYIIQSNAVYVYGTDAATYAPHAILNVKVADTVNEIKVSCRATEQTLMSACTIEPQDGQYDYNSFEIKPEFTVKNGTVELKEGTDYTVIYLNNTQIGTATAYIIGKGDGESGGDYVGAVKTTFTIKKGTFKPVANKLTFNNTNQELISLDASLKDGALKDKIKFALSDDQTKAVADYKTLTGKNAGTYRVYFWLDPSVTSLDNYDLPASKSGYVDVTIKPAPVTMAVTAKTSEIAYDGKEHALYTLMPSGEVYGAYGWSDHSFTGTETERALLYGKEAKEYTVNPSLWDMTKFKNTNTNFDVKFVAGTAGTVTISDQKAMSITITSVDNSSGTGYVYDGKNHSITVSGAPSGATIMYGTTKDTYNLSSNPSYKDVGYYPVYVKVTADGYKDYTGSGYVDISPKPLSITWGTTTLTYTGSEQAPKLTMSGKLSGDSLSYTIDGKESAVGGPYTAYLELTGSSADNYEIPDGKESIDFTIVNKTSTTSSTSGTSTTKSGSSTSSLTNSYNTTSKTNSTTGTTTSNKSSSTSSSSSTKSSSSSSTLNTDSDLSTSTSSFADSGTSGDDPLGVTGSGETYDDSDSVFADDFATYEDDEEEEEEEEDWDDEDWDEDSYEVDSEEYDSEGLMTYGRAVHLADPESYPVIYSILIGIFLFSLIAGAVFLIIANRKPKKDNL